jgi:hypothetical protein
MQMGILDKLFNNKCDKHLSGTITSISESWTVLNGQKNGKPMLIRKNVGCDQIAGNKNYSTKCGIAFMLLFPREDGLPNIENEPELNSLEDDIFDFFETDLNSIIPLIITTSGFREFVLYTKDINEFELRFKKLKDKYKQYELTNYNKFDDKWNTYHSFK